MDTKETALVVVDYINEIMNPKGKLAGKGYPVFAEQNGTMQNVRQLLSKARSSGYLIVHVRVGFSENYCEHPESSPLFGGAKKFGALKMGTWATEFDPGAQPLPGEVVIEKHRVSAFYGTPLDEILRCRGIKRVVIAGVATDLAVQAAARDAHDRDYSVVVVADCCAAANKEDHDASLKTLAKIASVTTLESIP